MSTKRTENLAGCDYELDSDNRIRSPGKFEGKPRWVPYFRDKGLEGFADLDLPESDEGHVPLWGFIVTEDDVALYPELAGVYAVSVEESDTGFVYSVELTQAGYEQLEAE